MKRLFSAIALFGLLSGCTWNLPEFMSFGSSNSGAITADGEVFDFTDLLPTFSDAQLELIEEGKLLRVTAIAPTQGYYSAVLVQVEGTATVLRFQVRAIAPLAVSQRPSKRGQQMLVARVLTFSDLEGVQFVEVISGQRKVQLRNR